MKKKSIKRTSNIITIYTTKHCSYCSMAKDFFKKHNLEFNEIDIGSDYKKAQEIIKKSGQLGVPVIQINNSIILGFDKKAIIKCLKS